MQVFEILERKGRDVAWVQPEATVADVVALLAERRIGAVVVSGDGNQVEGILSERDIVRSLAANGADALGLPASEVMTKRVHCCLPDHSVDELMDLMTERRVRHVPVLASDDSALDGLISIGDVVKHRVRELETENYRLERFVTTGWG